jgi:hypothetical protein
MDTDESGLDRDLAHALHRLADDTFVPDADPAREAALMAAFDAAPHPMPGSRGRQYWAMAALATAAAVLIAVGLTPGRAGRHGIPSEGRLPHGPAVASRGAQSAPAPSSVGEFVMVPGAALLPPMESGSVIRMDVAVSELPSLGVAPPAGSGSTVRADLIVGQDGFTRAFRLVLD